MFTIDVDTASYAIVRRDRNSATLLRPESVRVDEFINVFDYGYAGPDDPETLFLVDLELTPSHFGEGLLLLRVGIQGFETGPADRASANLVSTNGADGIRTAYEIAQSAFLDGGTNRVIWCTAGDLNVGMTGDEFLGSGWRPPSRSSKRSSAAARTPPVLRSTSWSVWFAEHTPAATHR